MYIVGEGTIILIVFEIKKKNLDETAVDGRAVIKAFLSLITQSSTN
jgi:hypothetical protein